MDLLIYLRAGEVLAQRHAGGARIQCGNGVGGCAGDPGYDHEGPSDVCGYVTQPRDAKKMPFAGPDVETVLEVQVISWGYNLVKMWC